LPPGAAPGRPGAPRSGRAPGRDRRRLGRVGPPAGAGAARRVAAGRGVAMRLRAAQPAPPLPTGAEKVAAVDAMFDAIAPGYDVTNRVISLGLDVGWRRRTVRSLGLPAGSAVLDLACGTGDLCAELSRQGLVPIGADRSAGMLTAARHRFAAPAADRSAGLLTAARHRFAAPAADRSAGMPTAARHRFAAPAAASRPGRSALARRPGPAGPPPPFVRGDGLALPFRSGALDGLVCGFALRNFAALPPVLAECARVLRPGGRLALLEVDAPAQPLLRFGHRLWFGRIVPLVGGLVAARSGAPRARAAAAYRYLPASVAYLPPTRELPPLFPP